jgi:lipopolysaccharide biosynthesis glycosyltransferase
MDNRIHISLASDDNYSQHLGVTIYSILENAKNPQKILLHLVDGGIKDENKKRLEMISNSFGSKIKWIKGDMNDFINLESFGHISKATYFRLILPNILNKIKKLIYLDCDLIVEGDIEELWGLDLKDKLLFAVKDSYESEIQRKKVLNIPKANSFFNSGVLLINCDKWRDKKVSKITLDYIIKNSSILVAPDQDALNAIYYNDWGEIPFEWNFYFDTFKRPELKNLNKKRSFKPKIIHFVSSSKPWSFLDIHPLKKRYWHYLKKTPWKNYKEKDKTLKNFFIKMLRYIRTYCPLGIKKFFKS